MNSRGAEASGSAGVFGVTDVPLPLAGEAADADRRALEEWQVPDRVLMESAGRAAAMVLQRLYPEGRVVGVAGPGNNGGDAAVMLRVLHAWGRDVALVAASHRAPAAGLLHGTEVPLLQGAEAEAAVAAAGVLVDGLLGTGAAGPPRDWAAAWIRRMDAADAPVVALDLPSGVDADTGAVHDPCIRAACTIAFGWPKLGLMLHPARQRCGRLVAVEIGFPPGCADGFRARAITGGWARHRIPARAPDAHKSSAGRLLVLAGTDGMAGAGIIAVEAALRAGAGLIRVASHGCNREALQSVVPEATFLDRDRLEESDVDGFHALVAGPGLGQDPAGAAALGRMLELTPGVPTLLDADALNVLAREPDRLRGLAGQRPLLVTPHARELSRLTGASMDEILADMPGAARQWARHFGCTVLLKGQPSLVASPDGALRVATTGSSDVAAAGMGDQLAGVIGALLAAGLGTDDAAALGLHLSGRAADLCGLGRSLGPRDVSSAMPAALNDPGPRSSSLGLPFITFDQPPRW
jgi:ADP-dependent NAD(P)H-hydrate dehydratase / NAD(P)H-hydrate epimerase